MFSPEQLADIAVQNLPKACTTAMANFDHVTPLLPRDDPRRH